MVKISNTTVGTRCQTAICNSDLQNQNVVAYYNLTNRSSCPKLKIIPKIQRGLDDMSKMSYKDLERSIRTFGYAYQPILVSADGYILDGQHRWKIVENLWEKGINVGISIVISPYVSITDPNIREIIIDLQKGRAWTPEDKLKSLAATGNENAKFLLEMSNERTVYLKSGKFGYRNSTAAFGFSPDLIDYGMPAVCSKESYDLARKIYDETNTLLSLGLKDKDAGNNWIEGFIKAWRRIRTNDPNLKSEDENGDRTTIDTKALNSIIDTLGLVKIGVMWRHYADKAFANARMGKWAYVFEKTIIETYNYENKIKE